VKNVNGINSVILITDNDNHNDKVKKLRMQMTVKKNRIITGTIMMRTM
jgi:hypothetical protein